MGLKEQIDADIKKAMMARNKEELEALRAIKSLILLAETEKGGVGQLTPEAEKRLLMKAAKQRRESAGIFDEQGRGDLAGRERLQLAVIERYLPQQLDEAQIEQVVREVIRETGAGGPQDMGKVMGAATKRLAGEAEGKTISEIVRKLLGP